MNRRERLPVDGPCELVVRLASGRVEVAEGEPGTVEVEVDGPKADEFTISAAGSRVVVEQPSGGLRWSRHTVVVRAADVDRLDAKLASADLLLDLAPGAVEVDVASGDLRMGDCRGAVRVRSASGSVSLGSLAGGASLSTASGDVAVEAVGGDAKVTTASGDVWVGSCAGAFSARSASGDVRLGRYDGTDISAVSMSGDVSVGFPSGRELVTDLKAVSGDVRSLFGEREPDPDEADPVAVRVRLRTTSGDVTIRPA